MSTAARTNIRCIGGSNVSPHLETLEACFGDARHGLPPVLGQGAGLAMMNAPSLAVGLDQSDDIEAALQQREQAERPLTEHTRDRSRTLLAMTARFSSPEATPWSNVPLRAARCVPVGTVP